MKRSSLLLFLFLLIYAAIRWPLIIHRHIDFDELEHLHAALSLSHGLIPYRDFLELHPPLFYFLLAPFTHADSPFAMVIGGRTLMLLCVMPLFLCLWRWTESRAGLAQAAIAAVLLGSFTCFSIKSMEIRPDVPAAAFMGCLIYLKPRVESRNHWFGIGALLGLTLLLSVKSLLPALGWALGLAGSRGIRQGVSILRWVAAGAVVPIIVLITWLGLHHALEPAWACLVTLSGRLSGWPLMETLGPALRDNPLVWVAGLAGALLSIRNEPAAVGAMSGSLLLLVVSPSNYLQNYLFLAPFISGFAAIGLKRGWDTAALLRFDRGKQQRSYVPSVVAVVAAGSIAWSLVRQWPLMRQSNRAQRAAFACVREHTGPGDRVFDVWSGDAFFRPHASYFWYLPPDILGILDTKSLTDGLLAALRDPRCRAVVRDPAAWANLPAPVRAMLRSSFKPVCDRLSIR